MPDLATSIGLHSMKRTRKNLKKLFCSIILPLRHATCVGDYTATLGSLVMDDEKTLRPGH